VKPAQTALFLDLDGPILECKARHYACYDDLCRERGLNALDRNEYWRLKRRRTPARGIFTSSGASSGQEELQRVWVARVEEPRYLALDFVHDGVNTALSSWTNAGLRLFLVTLRRNRYGLQEELERLELSRYFERMAVCDPTLGARGKASEAARIAPDVDFRRAAWIGDTEVDANAAAILGCAKLYLVTCGIRDEPYLRSLNTGEVVANLAAVEQRLAAGL